MQGTLTLRRFRREHTRDAERTLRQVLRRGPLPPDLKDGFVISTMENTLPRRVFRIVASHIDGITPNDEISTTYARSLRLAVLETVYFIATRGNQEGMPIDTRPVHSKRISRKLREIAEEKYSQRDIYCASELNGLADTIDASRRPKYLG